MAVANWGAIARGARYDACCSFGETEALHLLHRETVHRETVPVPGERDTYPWST